MNDLFNIGEAERFGLMAPILAGFIAFLMVDRTGMTPRVIVVI